MKSRTKPPLQLISVCFALLLFATACGQKPEVHVVGSGGGGQFASEEQLAEGEVAGEGGLEPGAAGGQSGGAGGTGGGTQKGGGTAAQGGGGPSGPGDTTGVTATGIKIGFHAPITGAASVALEDIAGGVNLLKQYLEGKGIKIHGRSTTTILKDDQYNPSTAVAVCRELVEQEKVFMLIGGGGTDQVIACARYAGSKGVPYISAGVTETVLKGLKNYFAFSPSYPDQSKPLVQMIKNFDAGPARGGRVLVDRCNEAAAGTCMDPDNNNTGPGPNKPKVAIIYSDTEGFYDARDAFIAAHKEEFGGESPIVKDITKFNISGNEATQLVTQFKQQGVDVIFILTSPTNWTTLMSAAGSRSSGQSYFPRWVGVGVTKGLDIIPRLLACPSYPAAFKNSLVFSPWFSVRHPDAAQFAEAWRAYSNDSRDYKRVDLAWGTYGGTIAIAAMLHNAGKNLTRQGFIAATQQAQNLKWTPDMGIELKQVYGAASYSAGNHFGVKEFHVLHGVCVGGEEQGYWDHIPGQGHFVSGF
ncbi:MAG TPA: ABC transporter substrate-binding protein [Actinomycetota bacterium]|nr:ABC transporter substrate-binding protein [Actinomycetota bacterium]